jgi:hypothetical protein
MYGKGTRLFLAGHREYLILSKAWQQNDCYEFIRKCMLKITHRCGRWLSKLNWGSGHSCYIYVQLSHLQVARRRIK